MSRIGIIGLGVVGSAVKHGLERIGHIVVGHDIKIPEIKITDVLETSICFICVDTPSNAEGVCDTSNVENVVNSLSEFQYQGIVAIKSTVLPGTTNKLILKHPNLKLVFCPEFLRERAAYTDFVENHDLCVIGAYNEEIFRIVADVHGPLPKKIVHLTPTEAELAKYFSNIFNALRIIFANEFFEVCKSMGADYTKIKNAMVHRSTIIDVYLDCNDNFRGFGGACLPKDTSAFAMFAEQLGLDMKLFRIIVEENKKFKKTVPDGMRE